ncbi:hypothetical protein HG535_0G00430 [Zygotorulaspora mrakii]|uniref:Uncharacterized protein n=1 Tax=Zygotorulaspora mrakii TaxID=42260 RepID=A0A7H9B605_ZYGMR|nr:uncharacterized protein HG535_0G00430 [Zygotorulaspora mrakii]QLG74158.1 hypothetical protein HG535_0G00430 [Zygotorulaspora mrakii]
MSDRKCEAELNDATTAVCPDCTTNLKKCLIQQNYAVVICPNLDCGYPFNQTQAINNIVYVKEKEIIEVAKSRLADK